MTTVARGSSGDEPVQKVVVIGATGVGKSELVNSYTKDKQTKRPAANVVEIKHVEEGVAVAFEVKRMQIYEVNSSSESCCAPDVLLQDCHGCILVSRADEKNSVRHAVSLLRKIRNLHLPNQRVLMVCNRPDASSRRHWQGTEEDDTVARARRARQVAAAAAVDFVDCTATNSDDAQLVFRRLLQNVQQAS